MAFLSRIESGEADFSTGVCSKDTTEKSVLSSGFDAIENCVECLE
jgi:hypothetical protein